MKQIKAIAWLSIKAAVRYRLFWALMAALLAAVILLPALIKDDGTARGFAQILLTYTLGSVTAILGFATLWLSCGALARDIEEAQIQLVAVKPIPRWKIWLGKWVGVVILNLLLLAISGLSIFGLLHWRASKLSPAEQRVLKNEILVSRGSAKEPAPDVNQDVENILAQRRKEVQITPENEPAVRQEIQEQVIAAQQVVGPNFRRIWQIDLGGVKEELRGKPVFIRTKFFAGQTNASGTYLATWYVGDPKNPRMAKMSLAPDTFHEFPVDSSLIGPDGKLYIEFRNYNESSLLFPFNEGMEVLYAEGSFAVNFIRGILIILFWLALLASIGLAAASFLSFPVAAFCSLVVLLLGLSAGTLTHVVEQGSVLGGGEPAKATRLLDMIMVPVFSGVLKVVQLVQAFSPVDSLSTGRSIPWLSVLRAFGQIILLMSGVFALIGIFTFSKRELARPVIS